MPKTEADYFGLRSRLVEVALEWERVFGVAPSITSAISELDAAILVGCPLAQYSVQMQGKTSVQKGFDFQFKGIRYQVKANRPSGKPGSRVTLVGKSKNYYWDRLIWILYKPGFSLQEAWMWEVEAYKVAFDLLPRLSPAHYRKGLRLK